MAANIEHSFPNPIVLPQDLRIFAIPGLGVDGRVYLQLSKFFPQLEIIEWLMPSENEGLVSYSQRMAQPIAAHKGRKILLGTSFGGIVSQEIAQFQQLDGLVLLSTFKKGDQKPWFFPLGEKLPLYQLFRGKWRYQLLPYWAPLFGIHDKEEQILLQDMFMNAPTEHRIWGAGQIVKWEGVPLNLPYLHLHGLEDRLFKAYNISNAQFLEGSGHYMVAQKAEEVSRMIKAWMVNEIFSPNPAE